MLASNKTFTKIYVRVFYSSRNDKIRRVNKFNILNVKDLLEAFIRTFTSRKFAFMGTILIPFVKESGLGGHDFIMFALNKQQVLRGTLRLVCKLQKEEVLLIN